MSPRSFFAGSSQEVFSPEISVRFETVQLQESAMGRIFSVLGSGLALAMAVAPAIAGNQVAVPEPASMSLLAVGVGGAYVARKFLRRK
jgi:hypothetical protein